MAPGAAAIHTYTRTPPGPPRYYSESLRQKYNLNGEVQLPNVVPVSADIGWEPDYEKYQARSRRRLEEGGLQSSLPNGWPLKIVSKLSWKGQDFDSDRDFTYVLQKHQKAEIDAALQYFKSLGLDGEEVSQDTFPLPHLQHVLRGLSEDLHSGNGFFVLRGLGETARSNEDNFLVYLGVSRYIADQHGRQDQNGNIVVHIHDTRSDLREPRMSRDTNQSQPFHTDVFSCIMALYTRSCSASGGDSILASSCNVYNQLASTRPDLIHVLASPDWTFDTFGRDPPYHQRPLLFYHKGRIILSFSRVAITGSAASPRNPRIPPITEAQAEALDAIQFIAQRDQIKMSMMPGDVRFVNNLAVMHCRDSFEDNERTYRHLIRLWLRSSRAAWELPPVLQLAEDRVYEPDKDIEDIWAIEPPPPRGPNIPKGLIHKTSCE